MCSSSHACITGPRGRSTLRSRTMSWSASRAARHELYVQMGRPVLVHGQERKLGEELHASREIFRRLTF